MATVYWVGTADTVAQVTTVTVSGTLSSETFTISVGGVEIASHTDSTTVIADTVAALVAAWNASTHPYATKITATDSSPYIVLTSDIEGLPFVITLNTPGGSAGFSQAATTASAGPNHWDTAGNWSGGAVPVNADDVYLEDSSVNICWGLNQSAVTLGTLYIRQSFTGRIGLDRTQCAISANGVTYSPTHKEEYRDTYLRIGAGRIEIGEGDGNGSPRIKVHQEDTAACNWVIFNSCRSSADSPLPAIRALCDSTTTKMYVRSAPGGFGVAADAPDEDTDVENMYISARDGATWVQWDGTSHVANWHQVGGRNRLRMGASAVTTLVSEGGSLVTEGNGQVTLWTHDGGTAYCNHIKSGGNVITTLILNAGTVDTSQCLEAQTIGTTSFGGGKLIRDATLTLTTINFPDERTTVTVD